MLEAVEQEVLLRQGLDMEGRENGRNPQYITMLAFLLPSPPSSPSSSFIVFIAF